jgi:hypothetical protein
MRVTRKTLFLLSILLAAGASGFGGDIATNRADAATTSSPATPALALTSEPAETESTCGGAGVRAPILASTLPRPVLINYATPAVSLFRYKVNTFANPDNAPRVKAKRGSWPLVVAGLGAMVAGIYFYSTSTEEMTVDIGYGSRDLKFVDNVRRRSGIGLMAAGGGLTVAGLLIRR